MLFVAAAEGERVVSSCLQLLLAGGSGSNLVPLAMYFVPGLYLDCLPD